VAVAAVRVFQEQEAQVVLVVVEQGERKVLVELLALPTQAVAVVVKVVVLEAQQLVVLAVQVWSLFDTQIVLLTLRLSVVG
jgi:hypothetical protein